MRITFRERGKGRIQYGKLEYKQFQILNKLQNEVEYRKILEEFIIQLSVCQCVSVACNK